MKISELCEMIHSLKDESQLLILLNKIKIELLGGIYELPKNLCELSTVNNYKQFKIGKRKGGYRYIYSPKGNLKFVQLGLKQIFELQYAPMPCAYGFSIGRSIIDNALCHTKKNFVYNIDLKNFFSSITENMICERLQQPPFKYNKVIANIMAQLCTVCQKEVRCLPQGAPTSPLLSNAMCDKMDIELMSLAEKYNAQYSRYADDITFSSNENIYECGFRKELISIIHSHCFKVNYAKERLQPKSMRQIVTGLVVNEKINVRREYVKNISILLHIWNKFGYEQACRVFVKQYSKAILLGYYSGFVDMENSLFGKLSYLRMVRGEQDSQVRKLIRLFLSLRRRKQEISH